VHPHAFEGRAGGVERGHDGVGLPDGQRDDDVAVRLRVPDDRDGFAAALREEYNVGSGMFYPVPNHRLLPFQVDVDLPETEQAAAECLSLPVHPSLSQDDLERIVLVPETLPASLAVDVGGSPFAWRVESDGDRRAIMPSMKKVACHPSRSSSARNAGVDSGSGPSSKVSATWSGRPRPTIAGVKRIPNGETPASAGTLCTAASAPAAPAAAAPTAAAGFSAVPRGVESSARRPTRGRAGPRVRSRSSSATSTRGLGLCSPWSQR